MKFIYSNGFKIFLLFLAFLLGFIVSVSVGSVRIPLKYTFEIFFSKYLGIGINETFQSEYYEIITRVRLPRVLLGMVVGVSLSVAGLIFQALLRNPLADPYTLGISAGSAFGAGLAILFSYVISSVFKSLIPLFAFIGGISTVFIVYFLARARGRIQILTIILSGVVVSYLFSSGLVFIMSILGDRAHEVIFWLMGSLAGYHKSQLTASILIILLSIFTFGFFRDLDIILLGDDQAKALGVNVELVRILLFGIASLITATAVSLSGTIGFVGLIIPHTMRLVFGPKHKKLIPSTIVAGATFLPLSDTLARTIPGFILGGGVEVPVGVVTSIFGSPFFLFLLIKGKKKYWF